jgi:hypothetical protein
MLLEWILYQVVSLIWSLVLDDATASLLGSLSRMCHGFFFYLGVDEQAYVFSVDQNRPIQFRQPDKLAVAEHRFSSAHPTLGHQNPFHQSVVHVMAHVGGN